jgi:hypothetical protein
MRTPRRATLPRARTGPIGPATRLTDCASPSVFAWQVAQARASAASREGVPGNESNRTIMACT